MLITYLHAYKRCLGFIYRRYSFLGQLEKHASSKQTDFKNMCSNALILYKSSIMLQVLRKLRQV